MNTLPTFTRRRAFAPWRRFDDLEAEMDRWLHRALPTFEATEEFGWAPTVDLADADGEYILTAELPGVKPEDVDVNVEADSLTIKGRKTEERKEKTKEMRLYERRYGSFDRTFSLPRSVDAEHVKAEFENGVLTVHLPKREEAMGRKIPIEKTE